MLGEYLGGSFPECGNAFRFPALEQRVQSQFDPGSNLRSRATASDVFDAPPRPKSRRLPFFCTRTIQLFVPDDFTTR